MLGSDNNCRKAQLRLLHSLTFDRIYIWHFKSHFKYQEPNNILEMGTSIV